MIYPYSLPVEFYGDNHRWFVGTVVNATPPAGLEGRVRVRIHGVHNLYTGDIAESDLPWAQVVMPVTEGGISGHGRIPQLLSGVSVFGMFLDGVNSQLPLIFGSLNRVELPSQIQRKFSGKDETTYDYDQEKISNIISLELDDDTSVSGSLKRRRSQGLKFFIDNGYNMISTAAIIGNLEGINSFKLYGDDDDDTIGIGSWSKITGNRYKKLLDFGDLFKPAVNFRSYSVQLQFIVYELRTTFNLANKKLVRANTIDEASDIFTKYYLKQKNGNARKLSLTAYEELTT